LNLFHAVCRVFRRYQDFIVPALSVALAVYAYGTVQQYDEGAKVRATHEARR
jgi:hypothetical protein